MGKMAESLMVTKCLFSTVLPFLNFKFSQEYLKTVDHTQSMFHSPVQSFWKSKWDLGDE